MTTLAHAYTQTRTFARTHAHHTCTTKRKHARVRTKTRKRARTRTNPHARTHARTHDGTLIRQTSHVSMLPVVSLSLFHSWMPCLLIRDICPDVYAGLRFDIVLFFRARCMCHAAMPTRRDLSVATSWI